MKQKHWTQRLKEEMEKVKAERDQYKELYLRTLADFDNYRKRIQADWQKAVEFAAERLVYELLPVLDNFQRALEAADRTQDIRSFAQGVRMIYTQMLQTLQREGLEPIDPQDELFDPKYHEAVDTAESDTVEPNRVIQVLERGYLFKGKLLRPAKVIVSRAPQAVGQEEHHEEKEG